jgi:hypothetical protein
LAYAKSSRRTQQPAGLFLTRSIEQIFSCLNIRILWALVPVGPIDLMPLNDANCRRTQKPVVLVLRAISILSKEFSAATFGFLAP